MEDLTKLRKQCIDSLLLCTENAVKYLDEDKEEELAALKNCVQEYCSMEERQTYQARALEIVKRDTDASNLNTIDEKFISELKSMQASKRLKVNNHAFMQQFQKRLSQTTSQNLNESDIAITETEDTYLCPITKKPIEDPLRNSLCGHVYERAAIHRHISNRSRAKCPVVGCGNTEPIQMEHLLEDNELRQRLSARRRHRRSASSSPV